jgi:hypothetical protein
MLNILITFGYPGSNSFSKSLPVENKHHSPGKELKITVAVKNTLSNSREDEIVSIDLKKLKAKYPGFNEKAFYIKYGAKEIPSQLEDNIVSNEPGHILIPASFAPNEEKDFSIIYKAEGIERHKYEKRTQALLGIKKDFKKINGYYTGGEFINVDSAVVPKDHFAHDALYRIEGPGWESDKIVYRYYLDSRNRNDIFGKKVNELVLQKIGQNDLVSDSKESYSGMLDWGMDIFKVGESLGIGSIAAWDNSTSSGMVKTISKDDETKCYINNDLLRSGVYTKYLGWVVNNSKYDLYSDLSISAGSRLTKVSLMLRPQKPREAGSPLKLCTGLAKHENCIFIKSKVRQKWGYIALYGKQSLSGDNLGIAVFYEMNNLAKITSDSLSEIVVLTPMNGKLTYYFGAAWESEPNGIKTQKEFEVYLNLEALMLSHPIQVSY